MDNFWISRIMKLFYKKSVLPTYCTELCVTLALCHSVYLRMSGQGKICPSPLQEIYSKYKTSLGLFYFYYVVGVVTTGQPRPDTGRKVNVINLQSGSPPGSVSQSSDPDTSPWLLCVLSWELLFIISYF